MSKTSFFICVLFLSACASKTRHEVDPRQQQFFRVVGQGQLAVVAVELAKGYNPNQQNEGGVTPLMLASFRGHREMVQALLKAGALVNTFDSDNRTALYYALDGKNLEITEDLLKAEALVNIKDKQNLTPLMVASSQGQLKAVDLILNAGAMPNTADENGWTAIFLAVGNRSAQVTLRLLASGADINHQDSDGNSLAHLCVERGDLPLLKLLVEKGIKLDLRNKKAQTSKEMAFASLHFDISDYFQTRDQK